MLKLLIADDERVVREGIKNLCRWEERGIVLCGTAATGGEACEAILREAPDIVIMDIRMPVMTGIEVIRHTAPELPYTHFIILSGFGEFEYAKEAMAYGVSHFILKPCNDRKLLEVVDKVREEIRREQAKRREIRELRESFQRILPGLREQFLRDFVSGRLPEREVDYYRRLLGLEASRASVALLAPFERCTFEKHFFYLAAVGRLMGEERILLSGVASQKLLFVLEEQDYDGLFQLMKQVNHYMDADNGVTFHCAVCDSVEFTGLPSMFRRLEECLAQNAMLDRDGIITPEDIVFTRAPTAYSFAYGTLVANIRGGNVEESAALVDSFFRGLAEIHPSSQTANAYALQLFTHVSGQGEPEQIRMATQQMMGPAGEGDVGMMQGYIRELAVQIAEKNRHKNYENYSQQVRNVLMYVEKYLGDERLSLGWIAKELLYINVDYLGKIIKRELGERFSSYLLRRRIEAAQQVMDASPGVKIYEVARQVGFGDNTQYFSIQFKKMTGMTPTEYVHRQVKG